MRPKPVLYSKSCTGSLLVAFGCIFLYMHFFCLSYLLSARQFSPSSCRSNIKQRYLIVKIQFFTFSHAFGTSNCKLIVIDSEKVVAYCRRKSADVNDVTVTLFLGLRSVTNRLDYPVEDVSDMFVTISLDDDLLNEQQREALNPMSIKIESTTSMPSMPLSFNELRKK